MTIHTIILEILSFLPWLLYISQTSGVPNTLTATLKSHVSLRTPREYFYYSKHIMAK